MALRGFLYDKKGNMAGKIAESSLAMNIQGEFEMRSEPSVVKVLRRETEEVLLEVKFLGKDHVQIHKAKLYSIKGRPFEVTPKHWKIGDDAPRSGEDIDCGGEAGSVKKNLLRGPSPGRPPPLARPPPPRPPAPPPGPSAARRTGAPPRPPPPNYF